MAYRMAYFKHSADDLTMTIGATDPFGNPFSITVSDADFANTGDLETAMTAVYDYSVALGNTIEYAVDDDKLAAAIAETTTAIADKEDEIADLEALPDL